MMMSKSIEKCKKLTRETRFMKNILILTTASGFLKKFETENESSNRLENTSKCINAAEMHKIVEQT